MRKTLFLLNDSLEYKKLINKLIYSNIRVNVLEGYTEGLINIINEMNYDIILVEDDDSSKQKFNLIRLLARRYSDKRLILISDSKYEKNDNSKFESISKDDLMRNYRDIFIKYGAEIKGEIQEERSLISDDIELSEQIDSLDKFRGDFIISRNTKTVVKRKKHIVIVDDDDISLLVLANLLKTYDYEVTIFNESMEAVKKIKEMRKHGKKIDLFILDLMMPVIDGFTMLKHLRETKKFESTAVLISSARNDHEAIKKVLNYNVNGYLLKPYSKNFIIDRIEKVI
ncbi:MAG: response regulator [Clostridium sp.]|uniref:response regulator n=1 Tax=Clostridium sp. TaxID=1506 RepID=UPI00291508C8|nr:response regulator [Clostridium sp.]MDU5109456.1 response regulator [Clostridium sp.]